MLLLKDECALCKRVVSSSYLRRCLRCGKLYCLDCTTFTPDGYIICLNCARRAVSPGRLGTKYSPLSRYLLHRGTFTRRVVLRFGEIEGIIGDNLPLSAFRDAEWWKNNRFNAHGRAWMDVGWKVESVNAQNRTVVFIQVSQPQQSETAQKSKRVKKTEFFKRPLKFPQPKKPMLPSKTRIARVQARLKNIERQKMVGPAQRSKLRTKSAYQKRLFKPEAKPSKTSD